MIILFSNMGKSLLRDLAWFKAVKKINRENFKKYSYLFLTWLEKEFELTWVKYNPLFVHVYLKVQHEFMHRFYPIDSKVVRREGHSNKK